MTDSDSAPPAGGLTPKALKLQHSINNWSLLSPKQRTRSVCFMESSLFYYELGESWFSCSRAEKVTLNEFSWERAPTQNQALLRPAVLASQHALQRLNSDFVLSNNIWIHEILKFNYHYFLFRYSVTLTGLRYITPPQSWTLYFIDDLLN